jgi:histidinol-phosphate aminotransferase
VPTFEMLPHYARLCGGQVTEVEWFGGALPVESLAAAVGPETRVLGVVSPCNPTGAVVTADEVARLAAIDPSLLVVVDQAYGEFAEIDLTPILAEWPNVVSVRTLSKAYGLSGLRVGYAVAAPAIIAVLRAAAGPYSVARPSIACALRRLQEGASDVTAYVARVREERDTLTALLQELDAAPLPSQANFVLSKFADAAALDAALAGAGIKVRAFPKNPALAGYRRITCPADPADFDRLTTALRAALKGA